MNRHAFALCVAVLGGLLGFNVIKAVSSAPAPVTANIVIFARVLGVCVGAVVGLAVGAALAGLFGILTRSR